MFKNKNIKIAVLGAGAWGTAIAILLSLKGYTVYLWFYDKTAYNKAIKYKVNPYLHGIILGTVKPVEQIHEAYKNANYIVLANPAQYNRSVLQRLRGNEIDIPKNTIFVNLSKGIEISTGKLMLDVFAEELPKYAKTFCCLSGPNLANHVAERKITFTTIAGYDEESLKKVQTLFTTEYFKPHITNDIIGVLLGGALKNIYAIAAGISDGLNLGENAKAGLITRSINEMVNFSLAMGARPETFLGSSGIGDLILTAYSKNSRNFKLGYNLATKQNIRAIDLIAGQDQVVEGYYTVKAVYDKWKKINLGFDMPITEQLYKILYKNKQIKKAVEDLMLRQPKKESKIKKIIKKIKR